MLNGYTNTNITVILQGKEDRSQVPKKKTKKNKKKFLKNRPFANGNKDGNASEEKVLSPEKALDEKADDKLDDKAESESKKVEEVTVSADHELEDGECSDSSVEGCDDDKKSNASTSTASDDGKLVANIY